MLRIIALILTLFWTQLPASAQENTGISSTHAAALEMMEELGTKLESVREQRQKVARYTAIAKELAMLELKNEAGLLNTNALKAMTQIGIRYFSMKNTLENIEKLYAPGQIPPSVEVSGKYGRLKQSVDEAFRLLEESRQEIKQTSDFINAIKS